jgi:hypothetical protein
MMNCIRQVNHLKALTMILVLALLCAAVPFNSKADGWNKKSIITLSQTVEIPGRILEPGTYVIKLMDSTSDRHIVQILNADESQIYATILAIPDYRLQPTGETRFDFFERVAGSPQAIRSWFYPGDNYGNAFVYPKARTVEIAKATEQKVQAMSSELPPGVTEASPPAEKPSVARVEEAPVQKLAPQEKETLIAAAISPDPSAQSHDVVKAPKAMNHLLKTASGFPLAGLAGLLSLGAAVTLRVISRRAP